jgi:hypothetical protein
LKKVKKLEACFNGNERNSVTNIRVISCVYNWIRWSYEKISSHQLMGTLIQLENAMLQDWFIKIKLSEFMKEIFNYGDQQKKEKRIKKKIFCHEWKKSVKNMQQRDRNVIDDEKELNGNEIILPRFEKKQKMQVGKLLCQEKIKKSALQRKKETRKEDKKLLLKKNC